MIGDETHFWLNDYVINHNCRIWRGKNSPEILQVQLDSENAMYGVFYTQEAVMEAPYYFLVLKISLQRMVLLFVSKFELYRSIYVAPHVAIDTRDLLKIDFVIRSF